MIISITGATGNMLTPLIPEIIKNPSIDEIRVLTRNPNTKKVRGWKKKFGKKLTVIKGDIVEKGCVEELIKDANYLVHAAAIIPPLSDKDPLLSKRVNYSGTINVVETIKDINPDCALIHISTVAVYGNRDFKHPWGRVGDPLMPSPFDTYGSDKLKAEQYLVESSLKKWVVLRQTGVLYPNILMNNISDGLMFHTPLNVPIEWATDIDSSRLVNNILKSDIESEVDNFWKDIYNIGGGDSQRVTGFDTFQTGFSLMGGNAKKFLNPSWHATRNFHCFWFADSNELEDRFHFQSEGFEEFFKRAGKANPMVKFGRIVPPGLIKSLIFKPLLNDSNAPTYWIKKSIVPKVVASFGSVEKAAAVPNTWDKFPLLCENKNPDTGEHLDYKALKKKESAVLLPHGYHGDYKHVDYKDIKEAGEFRGLILKSESFDGNIYAPLEWTCKSCSRTFKLSAFGLLRGGYSCPCCTNGNPWEENRFNKHPFFSPLWRDTHSNEELAYSYAFDGDTPILYRE